jgi:hypothetical protein
MHELSKVRHNENMYRDNERVYYAGEITSTNDAGTKKENLDLFALTGQLGIKQVHERGKVLEAGLTTTGTEFQYFTDEQGEGQWDWNMIHGCVCDSGYTGPDCQLRTCPKGDDPITTGQLDEKQVIRCSSTNGTFTLNFKGETTASIDATDPFLVLQTKLEALTTVRSVTIESTSVTGTVCETTEDETNPPVTYVTFTGDPGPQATLIPDGRTSVTSRGLWDGHIQIVRYPNRISGTTITGVAGNKEYIECAGRGLCDETSGVCSCYSPVYAIDALGTCSTIADITDVCPGEIECSGHGVCQAMTCICSNGWVSGDCSIRTCPNGPSWFGYPSKDQLAHDFARPVECSAKGMCDRSKGECQCFAPFKGGSCEHMDCAGEPKCTGHGECLTMSQLALKATFNGDATDFSYGVDPHNTQTWDGQSVYGCNCDEGWEGHDCSQRSCPKGDDPLTYGQQREVQLLRCRGTVGTFEIGFRQATTGPIRYNVSAAELEAAIESLPTIGDVTVEFNNRTYEIEFSETTVINNTPGFYKNWTNYSYHTEFCNKDGTNYATITFESELNDLPDMKVDYSQLIDDTDGISELGSGFIELATDGSTLTHDFGNSSIKSVRGTRENKVCSGRGLCDHQTGRCQCYAGYGQSDGNGNRGSIGDCGYVVQYQARAAAE